MNEVQDVEFCDSDLVQAPFTQLKPNEGCGMVVSFLGKTKQSGYHWLARRGRGYRCDGDGCPACAAGLTQSWSAIALACGYLKNGGLQVGYIPLSRPAFREVSQLNGGKPKECNIRLTILDSKPMFNVRTSPALWTTTEMMRSQVETARTSPAIDALLESKLYERLTNDEWVRVIAGKNVKPLEDEDEK